MAFRSKSIIGYKKITMIFAETGVAGAGAICKLLTLRLASSASADKVTQYPHKKSRP